jgi:uncharacterized protein (DUF488 family)
VLFTIGYAGRTLRELIAVLKQHKIKILVDIRRWPTSKLWPVYKREKLEKSLPRAGIKYVWLGQLLGGYRRGYTAWMRTAEFRTGLKALLTLSRGRRVCIMCLERGWRGCHRRYIVRLLRARGISVQNLA